MIRALKQISNYPEHSSDLGPRRRPADCLAALPTCWGALSVVLSAESRCWGGGGGGVGGGGWGVGGFKSSQRKRLSGRIQDEPSVVPPAPSMNQPQRFGPQREVSATPGFRSVPECCLICFLPNPPPLPPSPWPIKMS